MTYLQAKIHGHKGFTDTVEANDEFWASPREYLRKSTLLSLARNVSGFELPPSIYSNTTFEDEESSIEAADAGLELAILMRFSLKKKTWLVATNESQGGRP